VLLCSKDLADSQGSQKSSVRGLTEPCAEPPADTTETVLHLSEMSRGKRALKTQQLPWAVEEFALADVRPQSLGTQGDEPPGQGWDEEFYQSEENQGLQPGEKTSTR